MSYAPRPIRRSPSTRGSNWPGLPGTTSRWPCRSTVGPSEGPSSARVTGNPRTSTWRASISRASSHPFTNPAASRIPSWWEVSYAISFSVRARSSTRLLAALGDLEERFGPGLVALRLLPRRRALVGVPETLLGLLEPLLQLSRVELVGRDRLADQHQGRVCEHLEPAFGLRPAAGLLPGKVQPQLGGDEARHEGSVVGEHPDLPHHGTGRELHHLAVEHRPLGSQDLGLEGVAVVRH